MLERSEIILTVAVLVYKDDTVLLVKHGESASHLTDSYGLPGGRIDKGESDEDTAVRELTEETGLQTTKKNLIEFPNNVYHASIPRKGGEIVNFSWRVFIARNFWGELKESTETRPEWIKLSEAEKYNLLPNVQRAIVDGLKFLQRNSKL